MKLGILALQGAVHPHREKFNSIGVETLEVKKAHDLLNIGGLVFPGGESTAMLRLIANQELWEPLKAFAQAKPTWGICAGAILLAKDVLSPNQNSLAAIPVSIERNSYGRQLNSFVSVLHPETEEFSSWQGAEGVFIRAPRIVACEPSVEVCFTQSNDPVMVRSNNVVATTFHPELTDSVRFHQWFANYCTHRAN